MDTEQPPQQNQVNQEKIKQIKAIKHTDSKGKIFLLILLAIILIAAAAFGGWWYRDNQAKDEISAKDARITQLEDEKAALESQLAEAESESESETTKNTETANTSPTDEELDTIQSAITSQNYSKAKSLMADKLTVILAASECCGERTPKQAIQDMAYLDSATTPWDFNLSQATLDKYAKGDYSSYFPSDALVGKSANNYVVSVTFDNSGSINGVFMTGDASLL